MAIREYRGRGGCQERIDALKDLLRQLQDASIDAFAMIRTRAEGVSERREAAAEMFASCSLADGLRGVLRFTEPANFVNCAT